MATDSGQKFIRRNRAPRVHITYEDPHDERLIELPFAMGVLADLSGNASQVAQQQMAERSDFKPWPRPLAQRPRPCFFLLSGENRENPRLSAQRSLEKALHSNQFHRCFNVRENRATTGR